MRVKQDERKKDKYRPCTSLNLPTNQTNCKQFYRFSSSVSFITQEKERQSIVHARACSFAPSCVRAGVLPSIVLVRECAFAASSVRRVFSLNRPCARVCFHCLFRARAFFRCLFRARTRTLASKAHLEIGFSNVNVFDPV